MKVGSLVVRVKDFNAESYNIFAKEGIIPPEKGNIYTVSGVNELPFADTTATAIMLEEVESHGRWFRADMFKEVQGPDEVNVDEIVEDAIFVLVEILNSPDKKQNYVR